MELSALLRKLLEDGVYRSQYHLAEAVGVQQPTINHWLKRQRRPDRESCRKLAHATGLSLVEIMDMVDRDTLDRPTGGQT